MGLFDYVDCDPVLLPEVHSDGLVLMLPAEGWQTKSLDPGMDQYRITAAGQLEIQRGEWCDPPRGDASNDHALWPGMGRWVPTGWEATSITADLTLCTSWHDPRPRHADFPEAVRCWGLELRAVVVGGTLHQPMSASEPHPSWLEPSGTAWTLLEEDLLRRIERIEQDRWNAVCARYRSSRLSPAGRLRRLLGRQLDPPARRQALRLLDALQFPLDKRMR